MVPISNLITLSSDSNLIQGFVAAPVRYISLLLIQVICFKSIFSLDSNKAYREAPINTVDMGHVEHSIYQRGQGPKCRQNRYNFGTWILRPPPPLPKCPKFSTDQHLGFCFDPLPPFGPMSQSLLFFLKASLIKAVAQVRKISINFIFCTKTKYNDSS